MKSIRMITCIYFFSLCLSGSSEKIAIKYGLEHELQLEDYFEIEWVDGNVKIHKKQDNLLDLSLDILNTATGTDLTRIDKEVEQQTNILVLKEHKYYKHPQVLLYRATRAKNGSLKIHYSRFLVRK